VIRVAVLAMTLDRQQDAGFGIMTPLFDLTEVVHAAQEVCPRDLRPMPFQGVAESVLLQQRAHRGVVALARRCIGNALRLGSCIHQTGTDHLGHFARWS
jgi:hypothetical protein